METIFKFIRTRFCEETPILFGRENRRERRKKERKKK